MANLAALGSGPTLAFGVGVLVVLAAVLVLGATRRQDQRAAIGHLSRETLKADQTRAFAESGPPRRPAGRELERRAASEHSSGATAVMIAPEVRPAQFVAPDPEVLGVTRRQFLNRSIVNVTGFGLGAFALATIGFLWPRASGGFGSKIRVGSLDDIRAKIAEGDGFYYLAEGRMWITEYPTSALDKARGVYQPAVLAGMEQGIVALYQKCPHLGCRVPQCVTSQWFECPCHGSQYNRVGEKKGGPAPRGMDRFPVEFSGDDVTVNTAVIVQGPPIGTNTTGQEAEGPHCIGGAGGE